MKRNSQTGNETAFLESWSSTTTRDRIIVTILIRMYCKYLFSNDF